jgi:hypothetical protein
MNELEPLSPEISALLDAERARPDVPLDERTAVLRSVERTLGLVPPPSGDGGSTSGAPPAAGPIGGTGGGVLAHPYVVAATTLVVAGAVGLALTLGLSSPAPRPVPLAATASEVANALPKPDVEMPPPASDALPAATASATPTASDRAAKAPPSADVVPGRDVDLAAERAILDTARAAVSRGQGAAALEALGQHARQFPRGRLGEEREVLTIQALSLSGRGDEARSRAARFRKAHPRSLMIRAVDAILGDSP